MTTVTETRPYEAQRTQFESETTGHVMTVKRDDGLYRHLRFAAPGTSMWSFELVTWPGYLAITGDIGDGWTFTRDTDMVEFFKPRREPYRIDPGYWWEKMPRQLRDAAKKFSAEKFRTVVTQAAAEWDIPDDERDRLAYQLTTHVFCAGDNEHEARTALDDFVFTEWDNGGRRHSFSDTWEWEFNDFDWHFILALFAITFGVEKYTAWKAEQIPEVNDRLLIDQGWTRPADEPLAVEPELERDCA